MFKEIGKVIFDSKTRKAVTKFAKASSTLAGMSNEEITKGLGGKMPKVTEEQILRELKKAQKK